MITDNYSDRTAYICPTYLVEVFGRFDEIDPVVFALDYLDCLTAVIGILFIYLTANVI